ncbi:MAG TPA: sigma-70 family RNA polymerase sigma factor [Rhodanobacteraceae bacterium]|jgi:RNA polymerase sigma-70 factor (ECF subfamily)
MSRFETTRWSIVVRAREDTAQARAALETLCRTYRPPVLAYIRGHGYPPDAAEDLAQSFFARFLENAWHADADPARGRFRTYLLTVLKRHLSDAAVEARALKRGGSFAFESLDEEHSDATSTDAPERAFERAWAIAVLQAALARLKTEADEAGKQDLFAALREFLVEAPDEEDYARVAAQLGLRRNTLAVAVHRLRQRLRDLVQAELAQTTASESDCEDEMSALGNALGPVVSATP